MWVPNKKAIDREKCRCNCFDTVFKGKTFSCNVSTVQCMILQVPGDGQSITSPTAISIGTICDASRPYYHRKTGFGKRMLHMFFD